MKYTVKLLPSLHHLCLICPQASTSLHQMPSTSTKARHKLQSLSQNHHLILPVNLFMGGSWMSSLTHGTQRMHLSTLEGVASIDGHKPTEAKSLSLGEYMFLTDFTFMFTLILVVGAHTLSLYHPC